MPAEAHVEPGDPGPTVRPRPLTIDVVLTFATKVLIVILGVGATVIVARALGPTGRGAVAVALSFTLLLIQFGSLGLHSANAYFAARDPAQISRILANTLWSALGIGLLLSVAGIGIRWAFPATLQGLDLLEVVVVLVGIPAALANQLLQSILLAEGRMVAYNGVELAMNVAMVVGLVVGLLVFSFGVLGAIVVIVGVNFGGTVVFLALLRHHAPRLGRVDVALLRAMLRYGTRLYLAGLLAYLVVRGNLILVNSYLGGAEAGQFSVAIAVWEGIGLLPAVVALNLFPRVARGDPGGDTGAVFRSLVLVYGLVCLATIPLARPGITALYGDAFADAVTLYYWALPGIFCYGMVSILSYHFAGRGFPLEALLVWVAGAVLNFAIVFALLSGEASAAPAAAAASSSYALVLALHMRMFAAEADGYRTLVPRPRETIGLIGDMLRVVRPQRAA